MLQATNLRRRYSDEASTMCVATARTAVPGCQVSQALLAASTVAQDDTICCKESRQPRTCYIRRHASNTVTRACTTVAAVLRYERRLALTRALTSRARKQPMTNRKPKSETLTAKPTRLSGVRALRNNITKTFRRKESAERQTWSM